MVMHKHHCFETESGFLAGPHCSKPRTHLRNTISLIFVLKTYQLLRDTKVEMLQVNGEYYGHGSMGMNLDPSQHHHLHNHHASMAAMQMPLNPGDGMI